MIAPDAPMPADVSPAALGSGLASATVLPQPATSTAALATAMTPSLSQPLDFSAPSWPEQMVQDIRHSTVGDIDAMTITLTPERLGTLQIRLEMQDGLTHVHIVTETPEAARAIAEAHPRLAEAMARAGLEMGNQSTGTMGGSGTSGGDANPRNGGQPAADSGINTAASEPDAAPTQTTAPRRSSLSSIDLIA